MQSVKQQYESFPYPPISFLALPRRDQGQALRYEKVNELGAAKDLADNHKGMRILVVGTGTLEALVVAQVHPRAAEVTALDISAASLARLRRRINWARGRNILQLAGLRGHRLPPVRLVEADIMGWGNEEQFDYIIASNVLQHTANPAATLGHLSSLLRPGGVLRVVTYPAMSRFWIRQTGCWLRWHGLTQTTANLKRRTKEVVGLLPERHPLRSCYDGHGETATHTGIVDSFFHACEKPLAPLAWQAASAAAGLELLGEAQSPWAQSGFLSELLPQCEKLSVWQRLQIMDDVLELTSSPVWWFSKTGEIKPVDQQPAPLQKEVQELATGEAVADLFNHKDKNWTLPSEIYWRLGQSIKQADTLLKMVDSSAEELIRLLRRDIGPRVARDGHELSGLSIGEYDTAALVNARPPLQELHWRQIAGQCPPGSALYYEGNKIPGEDLVRQAEWLQLYYGPLQPTIGPLSLKLA